ncbi:MAG: phenylalanyl-tRNA synthetase, beta subunit [Clostridia bacterium]|jgi:phenylalanyl-tRNA synthetase beta chain|uniref:phenylalanine--tRNA ligase subunit beta n=1 Tax=Petroclostridium xylanilyticum TaxID=1792311 RepID=UPI000B9897C0|nr:phenylalanine--tRNA ligase subunit beta [Petroclostridium xylanilyticum]MBZ4645536.1 phenylalanyl-tRNA synthetase, beta subunit [Clostridia bacterium]
MKIPMSWLKDYVDIEVTPEEYASAMTMSGSKVEGIEKTGEDIQNVVVGKILTVEKHPDADKLQVSQVDLGDEVVQIVTGATNIYAGACIPVARHGAKLPGGVTIKKGKLRGVESNGMMCSIEELGLTKEDYPNAPDHGILILDGEYALGKDIKEVLGLNENVIEFEITSNRPDCLSVIGLARETAVTLDKVFKRPLVKVKEAGEDVSAYASIEVLAPDLCPRYAARVIKNVKIEPSPKWMRDRLRACGVRSINNIVDITNYVMLEFGQPMHAFDLKNLSGNKIVVRRAEDEEIIQTLDGQERKLDSSMLVIADAEKPVAVAGVMGGANSEVTQDTKTILFESANFLGSSIRLTAKKLGMRTEASARFEKGLDVNNVVRALDRACQLITELGAGEVVNGIIDVNNSSVTPVQLKLRPDKINAFLGTNISKEYMVDILRKLEFEVDEEKMLVTVPTFRSDVESEADLAEEIARIYGYDKIESTLLSGKTTQGRKNRKQLLEDKIKNCLIAQGLSEIITYSFTSPKIFDYLNIPQDSELRKVVTISNPLGEENSIMRTTTLSGMLEVMARNYNHRVEQVKLFELGSIYIPKALPVQELPEEKLVVTLGMYGESDFYLLKGVVEELLYILGIQEYEIIPEKNNPSFHPGRTAKVYINQKELGIMGEVHPDVLENYELAVRSYVAMLDFNTLLENANMVAQYKPLPKYPAVTRDIAMLVKDEIMVKQIEDIIKQCSGKLLEDVKLFDVYKGKQIPEGMKSVAYSITFRASDRTLTDEDINKVFNKIINGLKTNLDAQLRE